MPLGHKGINILEFHALNITVFHLKMIKENCLMTKSNVTEALFKIL